jgi:hypothetical protein
MDRVVESRRFVGIGGLGCDLIPQPLGFHQILEKLRKRAAAGQRTGPFANIRMDGQQNLGVRRFVGFYSPPHGFSW